VFLSDDFTHPSSILQFTTAAERRGIKPDRLAPNKYKKRKGKKRVLPECNVEMLAHINDKSTFLLKKLSGTVNTYKDNNKSITFLVPCKH
jgi:hypothetical protein